MEGKSSERQARGEAGIAGRAPGLASPPREFEHPRHALATRFQPPPVPAAAERRFLSPVAVFVRVPGLFERMTRPGRSERSTRVKRSPHVGSMVTSCLALSVSLAALMAVTMPVDGRAATPSRWTVAADSVVVPPPPAPAPPAEPAPAPAPVDTATTPPPAPVDTMGTRPAPAAVAGDTLSAPPPLPVPSVAPPPPPAPPPLTRKQQRALAKQKQRDDKAAARAAKHPKKPADADPLAAWNKGKTWVMLRGGYAKSTEPGAASGAVGAGLGIQRFITARWALGLIGHGDLLGKFGGAAEIEYPITLEMTRHFRWQTALRPYLGAGGGVFYHKFYRTGDNESASGHRPAPLADWRSGMYMLGGANLPVSTRSILGLDARLAFVGGDPDVINPVFGPQRTQLTHYSLKLSWARAF